MTDAPVCVIGGGLAGIAAAVRLADRGAPVILLESRPHLGGATYSFERAGVLVDTGQHVFLRCYTAYRSLLSRLGVSDLAPVQDRFTIPVVRPCGRGGTREEVSWLRRGHGVPAPLHLAPTLARYAPLSVSERWRAATAALALRSVDPASAEADTQTFGSWLRQHGQTPRAVEALWGLITVAALNVHPDEASLALAARVFRTALLEDAEAADLGIPSVPLRQLHADPAELLLDRLGVRVHTRARVTAVEALDRGTASDRRAPDRRELDGWAPAYLLRTPAGDLTASAVVVAVPHPVAARLVPPEAAPDRDRWAELGSTPIVNVHLHYDRTVTDLPYAAGLDSPVQWVFDRTRAAGMDSGQYLVVSLSASDAHADTPTATLVATFTDALADLFPQARQARVLESYVSRERHATFRQAPGTAALRPAARTRLPGLTLAGAWTGTGWPDTMESAVRSGLLAADSIVRDRSDPGLTPTRVLREATS